MLEERRAGCYFGKPIKRLSYILKVKVCKRKCNSKELNVKIIETWNALKKNLVAIMPKQIHTVVKAKC